MSIGLLIVNPVLQQYKSLGTYGIFKKVVFPLLKQWEKKSPLFKELGFIALLLKYLYTKGQLPFHIVT